MRVLFFLAGIGLIVHACSPVSKTGLRRSMMAAEKKFQDHTGFVLYDLSKRKTVYAYNADKYFTPASNTKIFTLYAGLKILGDSIPALKYEESGDSLIFWGTGDPSFLYKHTFNSNRVYDFLKNTDKKLFFSSSNFHTAHFGPGWAWDDYNDYYSPERSPFPIYGNILTVQKIQPGVVEVYPSCFKSFLSQGELAEMDRIVRQLHSNDLVFYPGKDSSSMQEWEIPIRVDRKTITWLLADTLDQPVHEIARFPSPVTKTLYSVPADSLYRVLMQDSDNFIAEQLLMLCAGVLSDTLKPEITIDFMKHHYLNDLPDKPVWVDGSGLSRYNLFTPRSIVRLWEKIYEIVPQERLFALLASGGNNGTLRNWFKSEKAYIFGKTGTLSNNHNLSGFLITKRGKTFIFAFMNNSYTVPTSAIRKNMEEILNRIHEKY